MSAVRQQPVLPLLVDHSMQMKLVLRQRCGRRVPDQLDIQLERRPGSGCIACDPTCSLYRPARPTDTYVVHLDELTVRVQRAGVDAAECEAVLVGGKLVQEGGAGRRLQPSSSSFCYRRRGALAEGGLGSATSQDLSAACRVCHSCKWRCRVGASSFFIRGEPRKRALPVRAATRFRAAAAWARRQRHQARRQAPPPRWPAGLSLLHSLLAARAARVAGGLGAAAGAGAGGASVETPSPSPIAFFFLSSR